MNHEAGGDGSSANCRLSYDFPGDDTDRFAWFCPGALEGDAEWEAKIIETGWPPGITYITLNQSVQIDDD
ncbi:hypothetical protein LN650_00065 [Klebsiella pneumoniae subsp. pneumoniae]|nr:hypothetical protein [Klebsiella pneumoniae subsp. pneumoniae]